MIQELPASALQYWGVIRGQVANRASTADLWAAINDFREQQGLGSIPGGIGAISKLRSLAVSQRSAVEMFAQADAHQTIDASWIAQDITSRPPDEQALTPMWKINFGVTRLTETGSETGWMTYVAIGALPPTKDDIVGLVQDKSVAIGIGSDSVVTGTTGDVEILAI